MKETEAKGDEQVTMSKQEVIDILRLMKSMERKLQEKIKAK